MTTHASPFFPSFLRPFAVSLLAVIPLMLLVSRGAADALVSLIALIFLIRMLLLRDFAWLRDPVYSIGLVLWVYMAVAVPFFSADPKEAAIQGIIWGRFPLFLMAVREWLCTSRQDMKHLGFSLAASIAIAWVDTLVQWLRGVSLSGHGLFDGKRLTGPLGKPNIGAYLAKMSFTMAALGGVYLKEHFSYKRLTSAALILVLAVGLVFLTGERAASILVLMAVPLMGGVVFLGEPRIRLQVSLMILAFMVAVGLLAAFNPYMQERIAFLISQLSRLKEAEYGQLWQAAFHISSEHQFLGVGINGFRALCPDLITKGIVHYCNIHPHNFYMEWLVEGGAAGLFGFILLVIFMVKQAFAMFPARGVHSWVMGAVLAVLLINFFPFNATQSFFSNWPAILIWYSISVSLAAARIMQGEKDDQ